MALDVFQYYVGYYQIIATNAVFAFVFDSWYVGQVVSLALTVTILIINEWFPLFKEGTNATDTVGVGFIFLLGALTFYIFNLLKWAAEYFILGHSLIGWITKAQKSELPYMKEGIFKKISNNAIRIFFHYTFVLAVLLIPIITFHFVKLANVHWGIPLHVGITWIVGLIVPPLYFVYAYFLAPYYISRVCEDDFKPESRKLKPYNWKFKEGMKTRYFVVALGGALVLAIIYLALPGFYLFEYHDKFLHNVADWFGLFWLWLVGVLVVIVGPGIIAIIGLILYKKDKPKTETELLAEEAMIT